jgi:hypothetical protein
MRLGQTCVHTRGLWLLLLAAGVEFIDENGGGPDVGLRNHQQPERRT